eukprot:3406676-Rhodomonas_salina.1
MYLETMREAYEAYVVYSFFKLMREFLGNKEQAVAKMKRLSERQGRSQAKMLWPCCCAYAWRLDGQFLTRCSLGIFQVAPHADRYMRLLSFACRIPCPMLT